MDLVNYILSESGWLYTKIYQNNIFFIDLWSFVHLLSGFTGYVMLRAARLKRPMTVLISVLVLYEVVEILFVYFAFMIFRPETIKDQFTDIFLGITGGMAGLFFLSMAERYYVTYPKIFLAFIMFAVSTICAFFWVGFYQYRYNVDFYNTRGINVSSFIGWTGGGIFIILVYLLFPKTKLLLRLSLTWVIFFLALLAFEFVFYYILEVRETTGFPLKPLLFGLIHGTRTLHVFYLIAPFIFLSIYQTGIWLVNRSRTIL